MNYSFHPSAKIEFDESINYYEECKSGLGAEFAKEVWATIQRVLKFPFAWPALSENTRRCLTKRFPYGVIYQIMESEIIIVSIMQLNRKPDYWKKRL